MFENFENFNEYELMIPDDVVRRVVYEQVSAHWKAYYAVPEQERLGDENFWDGALLNSVVEVGISPSQAKVFCELAKLEYQFDE